MADASQTSLYLTLPESAAIDVDETSAATLLKGAALISSTGNASAATFAAIVYTGGSRDTPLFLRRGWDFYTSEALGGVWQLRTPMASNGTVYYGGCKAAAFTIPSCRGVIINNSSDSVIYARKGPANTYGLTIAKPGDANGDNVQGTPIPANGDLILEHADFEAGDEWHLLGTAASQTATVSFI